MRRARRRGVDQEVGEGPSVWSMVKIVAVSVALIILLSFAAGYAFGRLFV